MELLFCYSVTLFLTLHNIFFGFDRLSKGIKLRQKRVKLLYEFDILKNCDYFVNNAILVYFYFVIILMILLFALLFG